ncbi:MAG: hydrocarbon degradation protein [Gammaproteobacteria bacterium]|nr:MAG: hydrocarbon degradation protein [Gammaproteobacteria bacterium]PIE38491.1 MAG: hydrocarbon degradation protein [Gammaproteobacteria bacterium]
MKRFAVRPVPLAVACGIGSAAFLSTGVQAAGFSLIEHGASGLGNAYAGAGAVAADGSTIFFNPAGIVELENSQFAGAFHLLDSNTDFTDEGSTTALALGGDELSGPDTASPGTTVLLPNLYYVNKVDERLSWGVGFGIPFGSSTEYDHDWKGRYITTKSGITVYDINPALGYRVNEQISVGLGLSVQVLTAELESAIDSGAACLGVASQGSSFTTTDCVNAGLTPNRQEVDSYGEVTGESVAGSFNLGLQYSPIDTLRIGVAYRHGVDHELDGEGDFTVNPQLQATLDSNDPAASTPEAAALAAGLFRDTDASAEVDLPSTFSISGAWQAYDRLQLLADITWTGWSSLHEIRVTYDNPVQPDTETLQEWEDVMRYSFGVNYDLNSKMRLRGGVAYDEEAIPGPYRRTPRIPGNDRTWIALGLGYQATGNLSFDVGFTHLMLDETPIDNTHEESPGGPVLRGTYDSSVDILSAQINWKFK